jgi:hypothetical protein
MSQIANLTGHTDTAMNYSNIAHDYMSQWTKLGFNLEANPPHAELSYNSPDSWGLLYNLFADRELDLGLVPQRVYDIQDAFYETVFDKYGVPLDTRHSYTKSKLAINLNVRHETVGLITLMCTDDWELFVASVSSPSLKQRFISTVANWLGTTPTNFAFTDLYDAVTGK